MMSDTCVTGETMFLTSAASRCEAGDNHWLSNLDCMGTVCCFLTKFLQHVLSLLCHVYLDIVMQERCTTNMQVSCW